MPPDLLLEADAIGRTAGGDRCLLDGVSLRVAAGERWAITGPTGAGKTLFLRVLSLLDAAEEGCVLWKGREINNDEVPEFRRDVIYLHQRPVLIEGSVEENLRLPFEFQANKSAEFDREFVMGQLESLGRDAQFLEKSSGELSGGESQIVALLRALELKPSVLLLDEPTAALDSDSVDSIETLVSRWLEEPGKQRATVWVSHDPEQIGRIAEKILRLDLGRPASAIGRP